MKARHVFAVSFGLSLLVAACRHSAELAGLADSDATSATESGAATGASTLTVALENGLFVLKPQHLGGGINALQRLTLKNAVHGKIPVETLKDRAWVRIPPTKTLDFDVTVSVGRGRYCRSIDDAKTPFLGSLPMKCIAPQTGALESAEGSGGASAEEPPFAMPAFCTQGGGKYLAPTKQQRQAICECPSLKGKKARFFLEKDVKSFAGRADAFAKLCGDS